MAGTPAVRRNGPCPCGSGKKYKYCCGRKNAAGAAPRGRAAAGPAVADMLREANAHHQTGRLEMAAELYRRVIGLDPQDAAALYYYGKLLGTTGRLEEGIAHLRRSVAADPARARVHVELASQLLWNRQADECVASVERALELGAADPLVLATAAGCLGRVNRVDDAIDAAERALVIAPDDAPCMITLARLREQRGEHDAARDLLERALAQPGLPPGARCAALRQLGVVLDRLGAYDAALEAVERSGAETLRLPRARQVDPSALSRRIADYRDDLGREDLARWTTSAVADGYAPPVFLMGFPRSGTTLTEQMLAAHPRVVTTDEEPLIPETIGAMRRAAGIDGTDGADGTPGTPGSDGTPGTGATSDVALLKRIDAEGIRRLRAFYRARADAVIDGGVGDRILVDKLPLNTVDVGFINVVFPDARVLFALRDPRDVCVSCIMQVWQGVPMHHFSSLARAVAFYAEVMSLWLDLRERITMPYLETRYEDVVDDPAGHARRLLGFLGLEWTDEVLAFHERQGDAYLYSLSYRDVAQPIYRRAVARWERYRKHFEPHAGTLAPFLAAFGYAAAEP